MSDEVPGMRKIPSNENILIGGPAGPLEAVLESPNGAEALGVAVVCHPHPLHGGTMQNKVVHTLARAFMSQRIAALRFNFRGVGASAGKFDHGAGELQDVLAAVAWATDRYAGLPSWLAGFSFGGAMAILASVSAAPSGLISIAPAVTRFAPDMDSQPSCPWLIVQGDQDELVDIDETVDYVNSLAPGPSLTVLQGGEHFFHGRLVELRRILEEFIAGSEP